MGEPEAGYDAVIVGAGPAGSACAWFAAAQGLRVLLVDAQTFPREKVCGDALSRTKAVPLLREMGWGKNGEVPPALTTCRELLIGSSQGARCSLALPGSGDWVCVRRECDWWLLQQARAKAEVREGFRVTSIVKEAGRVVGVRGIDVLSGQSRMFRSSLVIGSDGAYSVVAKEARLRSGGRGRRGVALRGYFTNLQPQPNRLEFYFLKRLLPGYLWVFPCDQGRSNVGIGVFRDDLVRQRVRLTDLFWRLVDEHPLLSARFHRAQLIDPLRGWPLPFWARRAPLSGDGVLLIGDAARLVDPLTGEGIGNALISGKLAAEVIGHACRARDFSRRILHRYDRELWRTLGHEMVLSRLLQRLVAQDWLVNGVVSSAQRHPLVARLLQAAFFAADGKRRLLSWPWGRGGRRSLDAEFSLSPQLTRPIL